MDTRVAINEDFLHLNPSYDGMMHDELLVGHGPSQKIILACRRKEG